MGPENPLQKVPVTDLMREAVDDARELVRLEVELAVCEAHDDFRAVQRAAVGFGVAAAAALVSLSLFAVALVLALGARAYVAAAIGGALLALAAAAAAVAYGALPGKPMQRSRARLKSDVQQIKEQFA